MLPRPRADLKPNTADFERFPLVKPTGFREYDARWLFPEEINLMGLTAVGLGMATLFDERGVKKRLVVGHDYRSYSASVKQALITGLLAGGCEVHDIGLALSPMAYFAQFDLDVEGVAMVTASHNDNGWTGIKMGMARPLTFGPDEMSRLKEIVLRRHLQDCRRRALHFRGRHGRALHEGAHRPSEAQAPPQGRRRVRQRHRRRLRAEGSRSHRLRGRAARRRARLHLPALQSQPRRHGDAARHRRGGGEAQGRRRPRLRRRRRPLRRRRQRGSRDLRRHRRRHAGARYLCPLQERGVRRRREVDRPVHDRSGAAGQRRQGALLEDRPLLHEALHLRAEGAGRLREERPLLLPAAARARLRRRPRRRAGGLRHARPRRGQDAWPT